MNKKNKKHKAIDPRYIGVPNINFSCCDPDDKREKKYAKQRLERGFDGSELWSLDCTIAQFIYPRLKEFIKYSNVPYGFCMFDQKTGIQYKKELSTEKAKKIWEDTLNKMLFSFEMIIDDDKRRKLQPKITVNKKGYEDFESEIQEGIDLFAKYFFCLWC